MARNLFCMKSPYAYIMYITLSNMWPDLRKPGYHTHLISWLCQIITHCQRYTRSKIWDIILISYKINIRNFNLLVYCDSELWFAKVWKLDVCGSLVFSNPVTYISCSKPPAAYFLESSFNKMMKLRSIHIPYCINNTINRL